jgi:hypothetical protein
MSKKKLESSDSESETDDDTLYCVTHAYQSLQNGCMETVFKIYKSYSKAKNYRESLNEDKNLCASCENNDSDEECECDFNYSSLKKINLKKKENKDGSIFYERVQT